MSLSQLNEFLTRWEGLWLFIILLAEFLVGIATFMILVIEYNYDRLFNEQLKAARKEARKKKIEEQISICEGEHK